MSENGHGAECANSEALEVATGELRETEEKCPGVWYVSTYGGGEQARREFYVAVKFNVMEQTESDNPLGWALNGAARPASAERMARLTPDAGTAFLLF